MTNKYKNAKALYTTVYIFFCIFVKPMQLYKNKILQFLEQNVAFIENQTFGVCSYWGDVWGISSGKIRLFFIYASFLAKGSPIIIYLALGFVMNLRKYYRLRRSRVWDF